MIYMETKKIEILKWSENGTTKTQKIKNKNKS
jgi:hypothetical protein